MIKPCKDCGETPAPQRIDMPPYGWGIACECYEPTVELEIRKPNPVTHTVVDEFMHGAIAKWNKKWGTA